MGGLGPELWDWDESYAGDLLFDYNNFSLPSLIIRPFTYLLCKRM